MQEGANVVIFDLKKHNDSPLEGGTPTLQAIGELKAINPYAGEAIYVQGDASKWHDVDKVSLLLMCCIQ